MSAPEQRPSAENGLRALLRNALSDAVHDAMDNTRGVHEEVRASRVEELLLSALDTALAEYPFAVTYQSPGGRSLTRCCCDRTTARLVVCPVHPETAPIPPADGGTHE